MNNNKKIEALIREAKNILVLTGAGMSTASGIPDFRSETGLYRENPEYILSLKYFFARTKKFYEFVKEKLYYPDVQPNQAHRILSKWEKEGKVYQVITQNIDGLHQKAGSQHVIDFHGNLQTGTCTGCEKKYQMDEVFSREGEKYFQCGCEGENSKYCLIKPDIVLYGEEGPWFKKEKLEEIREIVRQADLILILGTSLQVIPFAKFPEWRRYDVPIVIVNKGEVGTNYGKNTYYVYEDVVKTLEMWGK